MSDAIRLLQKLTRLQQRRGLLVAQGAAADSGRIKRLDARLEEMRAEYRQTQIAQFKAAE